MCCLHCWEMDPWPRCVLVIFDILFLQLLLPSSLSTDASPSPEVRLPSLPYWSWNLICVILIYSYGFSCALCSCYTRFMLFCSACLSLFCKRFSYKQDVFACRSRVLRNLLPPTCTFTVIVNKLEVNLPCHHSFLVRPSGLFFLRYFFPVSLGLIQYFLAPHSVYSGRFLATLLRVF